MRIQKYHQAKYRRKAIAAEDIRTYKIEKAQAAEEDARNRRATAVALTEWTNRLYELIDTMRRAKEAEETTKENKDNGTASN